MAQTLGTGAALLNIRFQIGSARSLVFNFGTTDLSGWTFELYVKQNKGARLKDISLTSPSAGISAPVYSSSSITATFSSIDTSITEGEYYWELRRTDLNIPLINGLAYFSYDAPDGDDSIDLQFTIGNSEINVTVSSSGGGGGTWGSITGTLSNQLDLQSALDLKQDDLVSGTNIKTVGGNSLLGSGNVPFPTSLPPSGSAGGELSGTYPNPTLSNAAVIGKLLTGFVSGAGTITSAKNILEAIQILDGNINAQVGVRKVVTAYGVLTSNSATTNAANLLTLIGSSSDGDSFFFPAGNYAFDPVAITKAINFVGDQATITLGTSNNPHWVFDKDLASLDGFIFVGQGRANATYPLQSAVKITNCSNIKVSRCSFMTMPKAGIEYLNTHIADSSSTFGSIGVVSCFFTKNKYGVYHDTRGEYVIYSGVTIVDNDSGMQIGSGNVVIGVSSITANTIGIDLVAGTNDAHGRVIGNDINHNTTAIRCTGILQGQFFTGNNIYFGVIEITSSLGVNFSDNTLANNTIRWNNSTGAIFNSIIAPTTPTLDTKYLGGDSAVVLYGNRDLNGALVAAFNKTPTQLPAATVTTTPYLPTPIAGDQIYVSDETGGGVPAFYDGTNWRRVTDRTIIAQTAKNATTQYNLVLAQSAGDTNPSAPIQTAGIAFLQELINADVLDYMDLIYVTGTDGNNAFATLNWVNPAVKQLTMVNTPGFAAGGFSSNGTTSYLNTGYVPSTDSVQYRLNDGGWFMAGNMASDASVAMGSLNTGVAGIDTQITSTFFAGRVNSISQATFSATDKRGNKSWAVTRNSASQVEGYVDGVSIGTQSLTSTQLPQYALYLLCRNSTGTAANFNNSANKLGLFMIGRGTKIKNNIAAIHTAWTNYKTAMGI